MSADRSHERLADLIPLDTIVGLEPGELAELRASLDEHGPGCAGCSSLIAIYTDAAALMAIALDPLPVRAGSEERLLAAARLGPRVAMLPIRPSPGEPIRLEDRRGPRRWITALAIAASLLVGILAGFSAAPRAPGGTSAFLSFAAQPGTKLATLQPIGTATEPLTVAYHPGEAGAWIFGSSLMKPSGGQIYELWYRPTGETAMHAAGVFVPVHGSVVAGVDVGTSFDLLAITVEPPGGSDQPTTTPIYATTTSPEPV